jgi:hypothetical protein
MDIVVRILLLFIFIQFLVVMTIMSVAMLLARPELSMFGGEPGHVTLRRSFAFVIHLPSRVRRSVTRLVHSIHLPSAH